MNADIPIAPRVEAGIYLTLEGNPGALSQFESHVFPHLHEIRPDFLAPVRMSAESLSQHEGVLMPWLLIQKQPQVPNSTQLEA